MAQVKLSSTELIEICNLIEEVALLGKKENIAGLFIDFMFMPASQCKKLADILQHISTDMYGFTKIDKELCDKLRKSINQTIRGLG